MRTFIVSNQTVQEEEVRQRIDRMKMVGASHARELADLLETLLQRNSGGSETLIATVNELRKTLFDRERQMADARFLLSQAQQRIEKATLGSKPTSVDDLTKGLAKLLSRAAEKLAL